MEYICKYCNKNYKSIHSRSNHYRIYHCEIHKQKSVESKSKVSQESVESKSKVSQVSVESKSKVSQVSVESKSKVSQELNRYMCKYCNNIYKHKQSKYNHEKKCKNKDIMHITSELKKENQEIKKENIEIKQMLNNILKQCKTAKLNSSKNIAKN